MPYIITTTDHTWPCGCDHGERVASRRAVATLDEARDAVVERIAPLGAATIADVIIESGGTIGPLPDGTVITVRHYTDRGFLIHAAGAGIQGDASSIAKVIDAYNAAQS